MKINELFQKPGFFRGLAKSIAPDTVNNIAASTNKTVDTTAADANSATYRDTAQARKLATELLNNPAKKAKLDNLANTIAGKAKGQGQGRTIDPDDIKDFMRGQGIAEAIQESPEFEQEYHYIVAKLQEKGIVVPGYVAPTDLIPTASAASAISHTNMKGAEAAGERAKFIASLKQLADQQGSKLSMSDIGKRIGVGGEYADPAKFTAAVNRTAQALQQQGVTITGVGAPSATNSATAQPGQSSSSMVGKYPKNPTIGGIGPTDPKYAALAAATRNAPTTPTV